MPSRRRVDQSERPRLTRLRLENIRCFESVSLDFTRDGKPTDWVVILGDNGTGKSTLLRSIALALAPPREAMSMMDAGARRSRSLSEDSSASWVRKGAKTGRIELEFEFGGSRHRTGHVLRQTRYGTEIAFEEFDDRSRRISELVRESAIVCGYGASRRSVSAEGHGRYSGLTATETLFDPEAPLQSPELALWRSRSSGRDIEDLLRSIDEILLLPAGSVRLQRDGLSIRGPWGFMSPVGSLSDGYRATLAWVLDLLGLAILKRPEALVDGLAGIVLIDEIEQHLHPAWQRRIIGHLHHQFPDLQFFVTTHAPLCVTGTTDLADDDVSLALLQWNEAPTERPAVTVISGAVPPRGLRADQVLTSYLFGLLTTEDDDTKSQIHHLARLLGKRSRTKDEEAVMSQLQQDLDEQLGSKETRLENAGAQLLGRALYQSLEDAIDRQVASLQDTDSEKRAIALEARRQFRELLGEKDS